MSEENRFTWLRCLLSETHSGLLKALVDATGRSKREIIEQAIEALAINRGMIDADDISDIEAQGLGSRVTEEGAYRLVPLDLPGDRACETNPIQSP